MQIPIGWAVTRNAALDDRNTFGVSARGAWLVEVWDPAALHAVLALPEAKHQRLLVLGAGSNVLFTGDFAGLVLVMANRGIELQSHERGSVQVRAAAGEGWHHLVCWTLARGLCGLENLSLIPGTVGAAPIQNIGAYGAELAESLQAVDAYDRVHGEPVRLTRAQCGFSYRDSVFKQQPERWIITGVELVLHGDAPLRCDYTGLHDELVAMGVGTPTAKDVAAAVCRLRRRKLPDPAVLGNAGSFFKNPVVSDQQAVRLQQAHAGLPLFGALGGQKKLSAAWLIERCGWKGFREGDAGVSDQHALVLVNYGSAAGAQIWALAQRIRDSVEQRFGVRLEPEPRIL